MGHANLREDWGRGSGKSLAKHPWLKQASIAELQADVQDSVRSGSGAEMHEKYARAELKRRWEKAAHSVRSETKAGRKYERSLKPRSKAARGPGGRFAKKASSRTVRRGTMGPRLPGGGFYSTGKKNYCSKCRGPHKFKHGRP